MNKRPWIIAGATIALAGFGTAVAAADGGAALNDPQPAPVVQQVDGAGAAPAAVDQSPESADSPAASPVDSADSAADSPDDVANQPGADTANTANTADTADSPN